MSDWPEKIWLRKNSDGPSITLIMDAAIMRPAQVDFDEGMVAEYVSADLLSAANARIEKLAKTALAAFPANWCDPLLTGPTAVLSTDGSVNCPEVERLLNAIRNRVREAFVALGDEG